MLEHKKYVQGQLTTTQKWGFDCGSGGQGYLGYSLILCFVFCVFLACIWLHDHNVAITLSCERET
jgi:hypothetical protein